MLVIIKSAPDTSDAKRAMKLAEEMSADVVLIQNGVYLTCSKLLKGFKGTTHVLEEDMRMRGVDCIETEMKRIGYEELVDLMAENEKVVGMF